MLIKAVAQAIPTYIMNCFKLPDSLYDELTSLIRNFWRIKNKMRGRWLRLVRTNYVNPRQPVEWVFVN